MHQFLVTEPWLKQFFKGLISNSSSSAQRLCMQKRSYLTTILTQTKINGWKICHGPCTWKISSVGKDQFNNCDYFLSWKLGPLFFFVVIQRMFSSWVHQRTLRLLFKDCRFFYFHSSIKSNFLVSKGLLCLYHKQKNMVACRYEISLTVFNSTSHFWRNPQVHGENRRVANLLVADCPSQPDCRICRKEGEKEN